MQELCLQYPIQFSAKKKSWFSLPKTLVAHKQAILNTFCLQFKKKFKRQRIQLQRLPSILQEFREIREAKWLQMIKFYGNKILPLQPKKIKKKVKIIVGRKKRR